MIKKFRKKPVVVECIQWDGSPESYEELVAWTGGLVRTTDTSLGLNLIQVYDKMHDTWINVFLGHRIIKGTEGEYYPHSGDNWDKVYEEVID